MECPQPQEWYDSLFCSIIFLYLFLQPHHDGRKWLCPRDSESTDWWCCWQTLQVSEMLLLFPSSRFSSRFNTLVDWLWQFHPPSGHLTSMWWLSQLWPTLAVGSDQEQAKLDLVQTVLGARPVTRFTYLVILHFPTIFLRHYYYILITAIRLTLFLKALNCV